MKKINEEWLLESLDRTLSPEEEQIRDQTLAENSLLRERYESFLQLEKEMASLRLGPSAEFVDTVMVSLGANPSVRQLVLQWYPRVAAACVILFVALLGVLWGVDTIEVPAQLIGVEETLSPEDAMAIWSE